MRRNIGYNTRFSKSNKKRIKCLIFMCFITIFCISQAFIYDIRVMRKWDPNNHHYCYFIGLGDFHDKHHKVTPLQSKQIDTLVQKCVPEKTKLIVEDIGSHGSGGRRCCGKFYINPNGGILGGLANKYRKRGLKSVDNVEYRFCRVVSLAPVVNNIHANYNSFLPTRIICVHNFQKEIVYTAKEILGYKDSHDLNSWYKKCVAHSVKDMQDLKFNSMSKMSVANYIYANANNQDNQNRAKNRLRFIKKLLTFDSCLIDAKIVHSIVSSPEKQNALVIAGGSHIRNVSRVLQSIGYNYLHRSKILFNREYNAKKCLGCHIAPGGFCRKPKPVDLQILHRFI
ncbi:hypothetical protein ACFLYU_03625 [Candidatus Dependentiae bacterium]